MSEKNPFHFCSTDDRAEPFGRLKFGADWVDRQTDRDLEVLKWFRPGLRREYVDIDDDRPPAPLPLEDWIVPYWLESDQKAEAYAARDRALKRRRQLAVVQEALRLVDEYGHQSKGPEDFERLDPGDDRDKLREARRIIASYSLTDAKARTPTPVPPPVTTAPAADTRKHDGSNSSMSSPDERRSEGIALSAKSDSVRGSRKKVVAPKIHASGDGRQKRAGPKERYDGERLREDTEVWLKSHEPFHSEEQYKRWCLEPGRTRLKAGALPPKNKKRGDAPDPHTLDDLLKRHKILDIPGLIAKR